MQSLFQVCQVLSLSLGLTQVFSHLWLSGAILTMFLDVPWPLSLGLPLVVLGMLALDFLGKS